MVALIVICEFNRRQIRICGKQIHKIVSDAKDFRLLRKVRFHSKVYT
nr:unnamed protein product [Callosobruchus analis]